MSYDLSNSLEELIDVLYEGEYFSDDSDINSFDEIYMNNEKETDKICDTIREIIDANNYTKIKQSLYEYNINALNDLLNLSEKYKEKKRMIDQIHTIEDFVIM